MQDDMQDPVPDTAEDTMQHQPGQSAPELVVKGSLDAEETAALAAVIQAAAVQAEDAHHEGAGGAGRDRTLERRRRLGLWARPGADSWRRAAGQR
jgi:hypothetical protein